MRDVSTGTLGKLVNLLELISTAQQPLRFMDVVKASQQPRATVHRQLAHLMSEGLIELSANQTYRPGMRLLTFASKAWEKNDLRMVASPFLQQLHELTGESIHLAVLSGCDVVYLDKLDARQNIRMHSQIGNRSPAYCTGVGKAALSLLSDDDVAARFAGYSFEPFTAQTLSSLDQLLEELASIRTSGFALDNEEHEVGIRCVAAPIARLANYQIAAISVTAPAFRIDEATLEHWKGVVPLHSKNIANALHASISPASI